MHDNDLTPDTDSVDALVESWRRADPSLDVSTVGIVSRLGRIRAHLESSMNEVLAEHGLTAGDFAALSILRRAGEDGAPMSRLADGLALTGGTVTTRVRRLVGAGFAHVARSTADARVHRVVLTELGRERFDAAAPAHLENQRRQLKALDPTEQAQLAVLLRRLLASLEHDHLD